jgi:hypothetical protein
VTGPPVSNLTIDDDRGPISTSARAEPPARGDSRAVRVLCYGLLVTAGGAAAGLLATGSQLPPIVPFLALAAVAGLCVNCEVFFASELTTTAESAAIFAAVVAFHGDARLLGPVAVGLAVGPLDLLHWRQRAYNRMAYNSGSQALAALAGAMVFSWLGGPRAVVVTVALVAIAALPYIVVDSTFGFALMRLRHEPVRVAVRHQWSVNALALPLACVGAVAGVIELSVGWWAALLVLAPVPWVPELVLVRAPSWLRTHRRTRAGVLVVALVATTVAGLAIAGDDDVAASLVPLLIAAGLGLDLRVDSTRAVPPFIAVVAMAGAVVAGAGGLVLAPLVAIVSVVVAWRADPPPRAVIVAALGGALTATVVRVGLRAGPRQAGLVLLAASAAGVFEIVAARGSRMRALHTELWWTAPLVLVAAVLAVWWLTLGPAGAGVFAVAGAAALLLVAWFAAPPWGSRWLGRHAARWAPRRHCVGLVVLAASAVATAAVALVARGAARDLAYAAAAQVEAAAACALAATRQWAFAPRRRVRDASVACLAALAVVGYLPLASNGSALSLGVIGALAGALVAFAWPYARLTDRAATAPVRHAEGDRPAAAVGGR